MVFDFHLCGVRFTPSLVSTLTYFNIGLEHILDINGYDHMLFLIVLLSGIEIERWKSMLGLITAFTLGHSLTLAIAVVNAPILSSEIVEFLIPVTILITAAANLVRKQADIYLSVIFTGIFGLIHGMGFAGYLSALMPRDASIWKPLLFFNLGVEAGQIIVAAAFVSVMFLAQYISKNAIHIAQRVFSVVGLGISLFLAAQNWIF